MLSPHMNNIALRALVLAIVAFAAPLFAASPEYPIGATVSTPAANYRAGASIATDGTDFFTVWADSRSSWSGAIIGTRVKRSGQVLDPLGLRISTSGSASLPNVVWDGAAYLVIWTSDYTSVYAARIDRDGRVVMAPRVIVENGATSGSRYAASNGNVTVVAYRSYRSGPHLPARIVVLGRDGNTLHDESLAPDNSSFRTGFAVAANSSRFAVAWGTNPGFDMWKTIVEAVALTPDGHVIGTPVNVGSGEAPAIGTDGSGFAILSRKWSEARVDLLSRTVNADLTEVSAEQNLVNGYNVDLPSVLWRGDRYEVVAGVRALWWDGKYDIASIELDRDGDRLAVRSRGNVDGGESTAQAVVAATNGADVLTAFNANTPTTFGTQIFGRVYRGSSLIYDVQSILSWSGNKQTNPEIALSAFGLFAGWTEESGVYATRIDPQGRSLDGRGVQLTTTSLRARVAFDGTNYVVAWLDWGFIGVRYIAPLNGATVAEVRVPTSTWRGLALAVSPEATYVVFTEERVRVTRIPHATHTPDPVPLTVSPEDMLVGDSAASWNGSALLVTWTEIAIPRGDPPIEIGTKILGARVTAGLSLLDPAPLTIAATNVEDEWFSFGAPSVASNGKDWLVITDLNREHVIARRVLSNGMVEGNGPATIAAGFAPVATWDGMRYAVAWREAPVPTSSNLRLALAAVPESGALVATRRTIVATQTAESLPSIARSGDEVAVAYTRISFRPEHTGVERSYFRVMDLAQKGRVVRR